MTDAHSENLFQEIEVVENVLKELGCQDKPVILALNKSELVSEEKLSEIKEKLAGYEVVEISAKQNKNVDVLLEKAVSKLPQTMKKAEYIIPYSDTAVSAYIHSNAVVENEEFLGEGIKIVAVVDEKVYNKCRKYMISE